MLKKKLKKTKKVKNYKKNKNNLKIISWNVNGLRSNSMSIIDKNNQFNNQSNLFKLIKKEDPDILCICETKCQKEHENIFSNLLPFQYKEWNSSIDRLGYSGVAIFSKIPLKKHKFIPGLESDLQGRYLVLETTNLLLIYAYVPNSGSNEKYRKEIWDPAIYNYLKKKKKEYENVIYFGDLNVVSDYNDIYNPQIIKKGKNAGVKDFERKTFKNFITKEPVGLGYCDALRKIYNDDKIWTWWDPRTKGREKDNGWRLDYFLVSNEKKIKDAKILNEYHGSDHCPIFLNISY